MRQASALDRQPAHRRGSGLLLTLVALARKVLLRLRIGHQTAELLRIREHHNLVMDSLQEGLILQDMQGNILTSNPAASRILGLTRDKITGRTSTDPRWQAIHEDGSPWPGEDHPAMRTLRTGLAETDVQMGLMRPDNSMVWISISTAPAGREGVVTTFTDITERRAVELRERELQDRFRLLIDGVRDYAIYMLDRSGKVSSWNIGAERLTGHTGAEIIGQHFSVFYPQEDIENGKPEKELLIAEASGRYAEEGWRLRRNGSRFWAQVVINSIRDDDGRLLGFAKISRDLSERREAEQALAEAAHLREAILESAPFSIIATDPDGTIRSINPTARRMLWYSSEELVGKATPALIHDAEEVRRRAMELSAETGQTIEAGFEVFVHQSRRGIVEEREWSYVRKDGSRFPVNLAVTALRDSGGEISGFLGIAYDITERKRREEYTQHVADHDHLTGLPNRGVLKDRLQQALTLSLRSGKSVAVLMLDLDHFKRVNDSLGHHVGDELLVAVAGRIRACVRAADTVARMGGDEFVVVLPDMDDQASAERVAQNILRAVSEPLTIGSHDLQVTPSIGLSFSPRDGNSAGVLLRNADAAMYSAKAAGRHEMRVFSSDIEQAALEKLTLEAAMRRALKNGEFVLHYQPQICVHSGRVVGVEALLRWPKAAGDRVSQESFIAVAEECGLILSIGHWVLRTACAQALELQRNSGKAIKLAVNISPKQFQQAAFVNELREILEQTGFPPEHLELEITENLLMSQTDHAIGRLHEIRGLGVGIAIDDFGVGYSSLSYIARFPISTLKIDRCFISKMSDSKSDIAVVKTIVDLASNLRINVVAEGVETGEQLAFLRSHASQGPQDRQAEGFLVQGFHFSPGVSFDRLAETLNRLEQAAPET